MYKPRAYKWQLTVIKHILPGIVEGCSSLISWSSFLDSFSSSFLIASLVSIPCPIYWLHTIVSPFLLVWTGVELFVILAPLATHTTSTKEKAALSQNRIVGTKFVMWNLQYSVKLSSVE